MPAGLLSELLEIFAEAIPHSLEVIGAAVRWPFTRNEKTFRKILEEQKSWWIGLLVLACITAIIIYLNI